MGGVYITLARHALIVISEETVNIDASEIMFDLLSILIIIQEFLALHFHFSKNSGANVTECHRFSTNIFKCANYIFVRQITIIFSNFQLFEELLEKRDAMLWGRTKIYKSRPLE